MEASEESVTLNNMSHCEFDEEANGYEESECTATECVSVRWMKPASVFELMFVSHDVLFVRVENTLLFHNVKTHNEELLIVGGDDKSSLADGDKFPLLLDGIGCVDCCGTDLLALSEHSPSTKVVVCRYPDMRVLATLIDNSNAATYKSIKLMKLEYLIGFRDYPAFDLVLWAWRIEEILLVVDTGFRLPDQSLTLHTTSSGRDVYLSQTERGLKCRLQLWTVSVSYKTAFAKRIPVECPAGVHITSGCWSSPSCTFVFCDTSMNVYRTRPGAPKSEMCVQHAGNADEQPSGAFVCPSAKGFVLCAANELTSFRDTDGVFTRIWMIFMDYTLYSLVAGDNCVYAWSDKGVLLKLTQKKEHQLKFYGADIKYFTFVGPTDETVATIDKTNSLRVWDVSTGELKSETKLNGHATNVCSNPVHHYVAVPFENGKVELWKTDPGANDLEKISKLVLCDDELSSVKFFANGNHCIVTSFPAGRFFHVNVRLGRMCIFVGTTHWKKRIVDVGIFENGRSSSVIAAVYADARSAGTAGHGVVVFDAKFNVVFETEDTRSRYTSVFKWTGLTSDAPDTVNIAFSAMNSRRVHLMAVNTKTRRSELKTVPLGHRLAPDGVMAHVRDDHCVTYGGDGAYDVYWFRADDGPRTRAATVNGCGQWQTGGLTAARIDAGARHVLTLSSRGNFVCTSFGYASRPDGDDGSSGRRDRRPDDRQPPAFGESMKTGGIGFEDAPGQKRTTLMAMMASQNETDPVYVANVSRKNRIREEFELIREKLVRLLDVNDNAPEDWKLDLEELDLNVEHRQRFRERSDVERQQYRVKVVREMAESEVQRDAIVRDHWESLSVKPKSLHCFNKWYEVCNYPITKTEQDVFTDTKRLFDDGSLTVKYGKTWQSACNRSYMETSLDNNTALSDSEFNRLINNKTFTGSISHQFIDIDDNLNFSPNDYTVETVKDEIIILRFTIAKLKRSFNQLFDESFAEKQNQLNNLNAHNERLRVIEDELRLTYKIEPTVYSTADYEWNQYEQTELLLRVEDREVPAKPYRRDASAVSLSSETDSAKRYRFRQHVLNVVLAGILEKTWAEKLRTDVVKPQCLLTKKRREDYTEDDWKSIAEYARAVVEKNEERAKYKRSLESEQISIGRQIVNIIRDLDNNVVEMYEIKAKYDAAVDQESLKMTRLSKALHEDDRQKRRIRLLEQADLETKRTIVEITKRIATVKEIRSSLLGTVETLRGKIKRIDKHLKSEFHSKPEHLEALIVYNRRPRVLPNNQKSASLLDYLFVETITDPSSNRAERLYTKFTKYLELLDIYDDYDKYLNENKLNNVSDVYDAPTWHTICYFRRLRIQSELHIIACQNDATDKVNLLDELTREMEAMVKRLKSSTVKKLKKRAFHYEPDVQLVVRLGYAELKLSGHVEDFNNATFVPRVAIEKMITKVEEVGQLKIDALSNLAVLKNKIRSIKPKHEVLKEHKVPLFKFRHTYMSNMGMSLNILLYLKCAASGVDMVEQAQLKLDQELLTIKYAYNKIKTRLTKTLDGQSESIRKCERINNKFEVDMYWAMADWAACHVNIDHDLTGRLKSACDIKTKRIMKRTKMMSSLQKVQKEIVMLQTELEVLRLKRDPTL